MNLRTDVGYRPQAHEKGGFISAHSQLTSCSRCNRHSHSPYHWFIRLPGAIQNDEGATKVFQCIYFYPISPIDKQGVHSLSVKNREMTDVFQSPSPSSAPVIDRSLIFIGSAMNWLFSPHGLQKDIQCKRCKFNNEMYIMRCCEDVTYSYSQSNSVQYESKFKSLGPL